MSLNKIPVNSITNVILECVNKNQLFEGYKLYELNTTNSKHPKVVTQYNFYFKSTLFSRKMQLIIKDYFKNQKIEIFIDKLDDSNLNRFDVKYHFLSLKINDVKQKFIFKCNTENELSKIFCDILNYISDKSDDSLKKILYGEDWVDTPFDWNGYK